MTIDYKPSDVHLLIPPLVGTLGHAEVEHAAAIIVRALQIGDHAWDRFVSADECCAAMETEPIVSLCRNPFFKPDPFKLIALGGAERRADGAMRLTELAIAKFSHYVSARPAVAERDRPDAPWTGEERAEVAATIDEIKQARAKIEAAIVRAKSHNDVEFVSDLLMIDGEFARTLAVFEARLRIEVAR